MHLLHTQSIISCNRLIIPNMCIGSCSWNLIMSIDIDIYAHLHVCSNCKQLTSAMHPIATCTYMYPRPTACVRPAAAASRRACVREHACVCVHFAIALVIARMRNCKYT